MGMATRAPALLQCTTLRPVVACRGDQSAGP